MSKKLDQSLINAYKAVYEEKRGHAAGSSDAEKQASQLASDVRYKAKGKVPDGATEEEKIKIFLQILGSSPAPSVVKSMAKEKLLGKKKTVKEAQYDNRYSDNTGEESKKKKKALEKKRGMKLDGHPQFTREAKDTSAMKKFLDDRAKKKEEEKKKQKPEYKNNPAFGDESHHSNRKNRNEEYVDETLKYTSHGPAIVGQKIDKTKETKITPDQRRKMKVESKMSPVELAIAKKRGRVKEGFSAWRTDLNFNEQLKK